MKLRMFKDCKGPGPDWTTLVETMFKAGVKLNRLEFEQTKSFYKDSEATDSLRNAFSTALKGGMLTPQGSITLFSPSGKYNSFFELGVAQACSDAKVRLYLYTKELYSTGSCKKCYPRR